MRGMKLPKFSLATMLLAVTVAAIVFGSIVAWQQIAIASSGGHPIPFSAHLENYVVTSAYWVPFGFLGYAIGRRRLSAWTVLALGIAQLLALGATYILVSSR
jgi:hypothetical protein